MRKWTVDVNRLVTISFLNNDFKTKAVVTFLTKECNKTACIFLLQKTTIKVIKIL